MNQDQPDIAAQQAAADAAAAEGVNEQIEQLRALDQRVALGRRRLACLGDGDIRFRKRREPLLRAHVDGT